MIKLVKFVVMLVVVLAFLGVAATYILPVYNAITWHANNCAATPVSETQVMLTCNNGKVFIGSQTEVLLVMSDL